MRCGRGLDAKGRLLRPAGKGSEGSFVLLSLITHHEILRIGSDRHHQHQQLRLLSSAAPQVVQEQQHVAPRICTQSVQPRVQPRRKKTRAAARRHLAPLAPEQHSTAQHIVAVGSLARLRMRALPQANAHCSIKRRDDRERQMRAAPCPGLSGKTGWKRKGEGRKREGKQRHPPAHVSWSSVYF